MYSKPCILIGWFETLSIWSKDCKNFWFDWDLVGGFELQDWITIYIYRCGDWFLEKGTCIFIHLLDLLLLRTPHAKIFQNKGFK